MRTDVEVMELAVTSARAAADLLWQRWLFSQRMEDHHMWHEAELRYWQTVQTYNYFIIRTPPKENRDARPF